jgi:hypothetical protein
VVVAAAPQVSVQEQEVRRLRLRADSLFLPVVRLV